MVIHGAIRGLLFVVALGLSTCHAPASTTTPPTSASTIAPPVQARVFDPDVVRRDAATPVGQLRAALDEGPPGRAVELTRELLARASADEERMHISWVGARAASRAGVSARAAELFAEIARTDHPLAPWARLERARILLEPEPAQAAAEAAPLTELSWAGQRDARELQAAALLRAGRAEEAEPLLRALLAEDPSGSAHASAAMPLAELLVARDAPDAKIEAVQLWRRVAMRAPFSRAARESEQRIEQTIAALAPELSARIGLPTTEDALARADALAAAMQHRDAEAAFAEVVRTTEEGALRCRARLGQGRAAYSARDRRRAADLLASVADDCDDADVRAWARFLAGKGYASAGDRERALAQYGELERQLPHHRLADDARFRSALVDADRADFASMTERLRTLPEAYPQGDMHGEARFLLAWRARQEGRREEALSYLEESLREGTGEEAEDIRGRAAYWRARLLADLGRADDAREGWTRLVEERPLGYYSQQAMRRLAELGLAAAESARASLGTRGDARITFPWRAEMDTPAFTRAIELLVVGELGAARAELEWVHRASEARDEDLRWLEAALLDRADAYPASVYLTRRHLSAFMERPPSGEHFARWRIAYPQAYSPLVDDAAEQRNLPPELVRAIAREESSFQADAVSVAHAYGLVQIIEPTARRFARRLDLTVSPTSLCDPRVNLAIGTEFMAWLWNRYETNPAVLPSAYNAGQGATDRWLRERPRQRLDEWIEDIPYDETRRYSRRVLQSWGIYTWLARGELPLLSASLPPAR